MNALGMGDVAEALDEIRRIMRSKAKRVYVFGSIVNHTAVPYESDVDVLIIPKKSLSHKRAYELLKKPLFLLLDKGLNLHALIVREKDKPRVLDEASRKGIVLV